MKHKDRAPSKKPPAAKSGYSRRDFFKGVGLAGAAAGLPANGLLGCASGPEAVAQEMGPGPAPVTLKVNGKEVKVSVEPRVTLLDALRDHLKLGSADPVDLTGSKRACDRGSCGACTMIVDGRTVYSCTTLAVDAQGKDIRTVEGLEKDGKLHPVQEEFIACDGMMCGFCTPGFIVSSAALLEKNPNPTREQIRRGLDGNICRCGTQPRALEAVEKAAKRKGR
jgi:xanthine dehydrogenase YagT iron-sulfur-binding subunit